MTRPHWKISMHSQTFQWKKKDWVFLSSQHFVKPSHYCCQLNSCHDTPLSLPCTLWGHIASSVLYILWTGPMRRCNSGGGRRHITGVLLPCLSHTIFGGGRGKLHSQNFCFFFFTFSFVFTLRFKQSSRITSFSLQCCVGWAILIKNIFCSITPCTRMIRAVTVIWEHTIVRTSTFFTVLVSLSSWR